jgi:hypothetical protein
VAHHAGSADVRELDWARHPREFQDQILPRSGFPRFVILSPGTEHIPARPNGWIMLWPPGEHHIGHTAADQLGGLADGLGQARIAPACLSGQGCSEHLLTPE